MLEELPLCKMSRRYVEKDVGRSNYRISFICSTLGEGGLVASRKRERRRSVGIEKIGNGDSKGMSESGCRVSDASVGRPAKSPVGCALLADDTHDIYDADALN